MRKATEEKPLRENHPWEEWEKKLVREGIKDRWKIRSQSNVAQLTKRSRPAIQQESHKLRKQMKKRTKKNQAVVRRSR